MKKLSVILFAFLFLAVGLLYVFQFTGKTKSDTSGSLPGVPANGIAYINIDSVILRFDMFLDRRNDLLAKQKTSEAELNSKAGLYEKDARDYQDKVNKGLVTRATAAEMEQLLLQKQQELVALRDKLQSNLVEEEQVMNRQILEYITKFLQENKADYNCQYILGKSFGSVVLYGDSGLDITKKVLDAVNLKYKADKK